MESLPKKLKLSETVSPDPFAVLNEDTREHIYQYLSGKDIIQLFLVSKGFSRGTNDSPAAMKKIQLKFYEKSTDNPSFKEVVELLNSERKYQNIDLTLRFFAIPLLFIQQFSESITNLRIKMRNGEFEKVCITPDLSLPKLKSLDWNGPGCTKFVKQALQTSKFLNKFSVEASTKNPKLLQALMDLTSINELKIYGKPEVFFEGEWLKNPKFKLTSLTIESNFYCKVDLQAQLNFKNFILHMADTLTSIKLNWYLPVDIEVLLNKLPVLKYLEICNFSCHYNKQNQLQPNQNIQEFKSRCHNEVVNKMILTALAGLKVLKLVYLSSENFDWIVLNMKGLKFLHLQNLDENNRNFSIYRTIKDTVKLRYNKLKACHHHPSTINADIEIIVMNP